MISWASTHSKRSKEALSLFDYIMLDVRATGLTVKPCCFDAVLMECEQEGFLKHEVSLWNNLGVAAGNLNAAMGFEAAMQRIAAASLAKTGEIDLLCCQESYGCDIGNATFACIWCE
eukprot:gnl/TRDRNA2_/TRDRNA2_129318_c0_seq1.p1 gnl/TRDRNA2_/TRDRNA2_129318_c0~~gnl/TRDRNA2_/TRDRNA2_129318_c0_seq1.p1  ORF type:complete len:117 (-),score=16.11 gnl/TRDRNA2_/TRDRNA2_129318_c0_seq1:17-367(-)